MSDFFRTRFAPAMIPDSQWPIVVALIVVSILAASVFVLPEGLMLVLLTALAIAYRKMWLVAIQMLVSLYLVTTTEYYATRGMQYFASGSVFLPNVLLPCLTAKWIA